MKLITYWGYAVAIVVIVAALAGYAVSNRSRTPTETPTFKIGVMTMLTGDLAFLGENVVRSAELAVADLEGQFNIDVQLIVEDVGNLSDQSRAISAFRKLTDVDGVEYIIDGMTSNATLAIAPLIDEARVTVVTPLTGGENIDTAAEYLFRNGPSDVQAGTLPADQLYNKFGYAVVAVLTDEAEYTLDIQKHFRNAFTGDIAVDEKIQPGLTDYRTPLLKAKDSDAQALVVHTATGTSAHTIIKQARELGITMPIFTNFIAFGPQLFTVAGAAAEGVYVYDPEFNENSRDVQAFLARYAEHYGASSPIPFHATGTYDGVKMGMEAFSQGATDGQGIHDYLLKNVQQWDGFNGTVSFDERGNADTGFVLKQIRSEQLVPVP